MVNISLRMSPIVPNTQWLFLPFAFPPWTQHHEFTCPIESSGAAKAFGVPIQQNNPTTIEVFPSKQATVMNGTSRLGIEVLLGGDPFVKCKPVDAVGTAPFNGLLSFDPARAKQSAAKIPFSQRIMAYLSKFANSPCVDHALHSPVQKERLRKEPLLHLLALFLLYRPCGAPAFSPRHLADLVLSLEFTDLLRIITKEAAQDIFGIPPYRLSTELRVAWCL